MIFLLPYQTMQNIMSHSQNSQSIQQTVVTILNNDGVIAYPTESVFGLGCNPDSEKALQKILTIKQRRTNKGLIILVSRLEQALCYLEPLSNQQIKNVSQISSRATTWLIPRRKNISELLCGQHEKLAIRITQHPIARNICEMTNSALVSTSCNLSGQPSLTTALDVKQQMGKQLDYIIDGQCGDQQPSRIIDLITGQILRE